MMSTGEFYTLAAALEADHRGALFLFALERHRQGKGDPSALPFDPGRNDAELPEETGDAAADV